MSPPASPRRRTRETAAAVGAALGLVPRIALQLDEIDFGDDWCGLSFAALNADPRWRAWNDDRERGVTPAGDTLAAVQRRIVGFVEDLRTAAEAVALVSHADVIKLAIAHYLGLPLPAIDRLDIAPASISIPELEPWGVKVLGLNEVPAERSDIHEDRHLRPHDQLLVG